MSHKLVIYSAARSGRLAIKTEILQSPTSELKPFHEAAPTPYPASLALLDEDRPAHAKIVNEEGRKTWREWHLAVGSLCAEARGGSSGADAAGAWGYRAQAIALHARQTTHNL